MGLNAKRSDAVLLLTALADDQREARNCQSISVRPITFFAQCMEKQFLDKVVNVMVFMRSHTKNWSLSENTKN